jgi:hypothetical protein
LVTLSFEILIRKPTQESVQRFPDGQAFSFLHPPVERQRPGKPNRLWYGNASLNCRNFGQSPSVTPSFTEIISEIGQHCDIA